jgi:hypothetical protein
MRALRFYGFSLLAWASGCSGYTPARFAERPPVTDAGDDAPIALPHWRWVPEPVYLSEIYLHRPVREALDLSLYPDAGDVNSFDEVARSTWFTPRAFDIGSMARGPETVGPPLPPFTVVPEGLMAVASGGFSIADSRGQKYEVALDPPDRPEMRTAATTIAARLFWALGYNTPPVFVFRARAEDFWRSEGAAPDVLALLKSGAPAVAGYYRLAAVAWPAGVVLGYAPESGVRGDDPNDLIPHQNRRTVRALKVFASWLALEGLGPSKTVDRYLGAPGEGHVVHYVVGLDEALGAANVARVTDAPPAEGGGSPFIRLITLGLYPNPAPQPTQSDIPAVGELDPDVDPSAFAPPLPYEPADRLLGPDGYWAAKRMVELSSSHIALAIDAGRISDPRAQRAIQAALEARRTKVMTYWFGRVTPLEVVSAAGTKLVVRDEAVHHGFATHDSTDYRIDFLTREGAGADEGSVVHPRGSVIELTLPSRALARAREYLVVQVTARRANHVLPRALEVHLKLAEGGLKVVGIRH